jgi:hypothetical protein
MYALPQSAQRRPTGAVTQDPNTQDDQMQQRNEYTAPLPPVQPQLSPLQSDGLPRMDPFFSSGQQGISISRPAQYNSKSI